MVAHCDSHYSHTDRTNASFDFDRCWTPQTMEPRGSDPQSPRQDMSTRRNCTEFGHSFWLGLSERVKIVGCQQISFFKAITHQLRFHGVPQTL